MTSIAARLGDLRRGERFFLALVANLQDADFETPSLLPGWTRAHVVAHVARNADALRNLLTWARTGVETPMYVSPDQRANDIDRSSGHARIDLRRDAETASSRLLHAADALPDEAWSAEVHTATGRRISTEEVPWLRLRETWVHAVDLGVGATFGDVPGAVVHQLIDEVAGGLGGRPDCPAVIMTDGVRLWSIGPGGEAVARVTGSQTAILAWLIGRADGSDLEGSAPQLPSWL
jgi:maleylpyruvate isomerase